MGLYQHCVIKSFKHDGHLHRTWQENWLIPTEQLAPEHLEQSMHVLINCQTPILEADGKLWTSRVPAVSFFIPGEWYNVVALIEEQGIRYYCNIASPPYLQGDVLTYIDYDLDVIRTADGSFSIVDEDEYERHKAAYHYPPMVEEKVQEGLNGLLQRIHNGEAPFQDELVLSYYEYWSANISKEGDGDA